MVLENWSLRRGGHNQRFDCIARLGIYYCLTDLTFIYKYEIFLLKIIPSLHVNSFIQLLLKTVEVQVETIYIDWMQKHYQLLNVDEHVHVTEQNLFSRYCV